jgi:HK97 family phage major capsid protein
MPSGYGTANAGAELTREQVEQVLLEPLLARAVVLAAGPQLFRSQGGVPLRIPKIDVLDVPDPWRAENTTIAEADPDYGEVVLLPSTLKSLKVIHRLSNELARHAVVNIVRALSAAFVRRVALALDRAMLVGDGAAGTITGLSAATGIQTMPAVGSPTVDHLHDAELRVLQANADPESAAWFMHPRDLVTLRKVKTTDGQYLVHPDPAEAGAYRLVGHRVHVTTQIPTNEGTGANESRILLADMSQVAVGIDDDFTFTLLDQTYGNYDQLAIRVTARFDIAPLNPQAVVVLQGVTP